MGHNQSLGEIFQERTQYNTYSFYQQKSVEALDRVEDKLSRAGFEVQTKTDPQEQIFRKAPRFGTTPEQRRPYYQNKDRLENPETLARIKFLTVSKGGVSQDFPMRIEHPQPSLLRRAMEDIGLSRHNANDDRPVVVLTGAGGQEHKFQTTKPRLEYDARWQTKRPGDASSTVQMTEFMVKELARKANAQATPRFNMP